MIKKYKSLPEGVKASFWFLVCGFFQKGISVITTPIFTRILSTEEYGQFSVFSSWLSILTVFVTLNLGGGVYTRGLIKNKDNKNSFIASMQGLTATLVFIWTVIYLVFKSMINEMLGLTTVQVLAMLVLMWISAILGFWSTEQRTDLRYKLLVVITLIVSVIKPTLGIFLVLHSDDKVTARILGMLLVDVIAYAWMFIYHVYIGKRYFDKAVWKYVILFNLPLIPHYLSMSVLNGSDRIMIGKMIGEGEAGIYNLAYSISQIMTIFNSALLQTIDPWLYKKIDANETSEITRIAYPSFLIICTINIILIAFAPEAVLIFAPSSYQNAKYIIPAVAMSVPFMFAYNFFAVFEFYYEKTRYIATATIIGAIANIFLNYVCIKQFGYFAAGYTTLMCYMLLALLHYFFMNKLCKQNNIEKVYDEKKLLMIVFTFLILGFMFLASYNNTIIRYGLLLIIAIVVLCMKQKLIKIISDLLSVRNNTK